MKYIDIGLKICFDDDTVLCRGNNSSQLEDAVSELFDGIFCDYVGYIKTEVKVGEEVE